LRITSARTRLPSAPVAGRSDRTQRCWPSPPRPESQGARQNGYGRSGPGGRHRSPGRSDRAGSRWA
jgi:hypothetical protein